MFFLWTVYSLLCALSKSLQDTVSKANLRTLDEYVVGFWSSFFAIILLFPFVVWQGIPPLWKDFFEAFIVSGSINIIVTILILKAYKTTDISLASPLSTLTPVFLIFVSPVLIWETLHFFWYIGIFFTVLGSYVLNMSSSDSWLFTPFKSLFHSKGSQYMLFVAFLWSISSVYDKIWVQNSSSIFWLLVLKLSSMGVIWIFLFCFKKNYTLPQKVIPLFFLSFIGTIGLFFQMLALQILPVMYVISLKRLSSVFSVVTWHFFFKEKGFKYRITWSLIMFVGIILLIL